MQSIFFVNSTGKLVIPSKSVLEKVFEKIKKFPILFPLNWEESLVDGVCDMAVIDSLGHTNEIKQNNNVIFCRSYGIWKKFAYSNCFVVNGIALKCWSKSYKSVKRIPSNTLVVITDGNLDDSVRDYILCDMKMKNYPISFVNEGDL